MEELNSIPEHTYLIVIAVIGGIWTLATFLISFRNEKLKERIEADKTVRGLNNELKVWADEVIDVLSEIVHLTEIDPKKTDIFFMKRIELLTSLSALIDKGRFYLPNTDKDIYGHHKPYAFQGITREPLTHMKNGYLILDNEISYLDQSVNKPLKEQLVATKREFCSSVQKELNPDKYFIELRKKISKH